jgi:hypothetical protein
MMRIDAAHAATGLSSDRSFNLFWSALHSLISKGVTMKCHGLLSLLLGLLLVGPQAFGQDDAEENIHYEKLKVLEPIIGTWSHIFPNRQTGGQIEHQTTYRWVATKRMIIADSIRRDITDGQAGPWTEGGPRTCYVWNQNQEPPCIEVYFFGTLAGWAGVSRVLPKGDNEFELIQTHITLDLGGGTANLTMTISDDEIVLMGRDRKDADGAALEDWESVSKRVKPKE